MTFQVLVKRLSPTLKRITRRLNGHHGFFDDEDLYQEALTHLWTAYTRGVVDDKTDSYLLQGCYFHLKNYLRTVQDNATFISLSEPVSEDGTTLQDYLVHDDSDVADEITGKIDIEFLKQRYLSKREGDVLDLFLAGMSMREIGVKLGVSHMMIWKIRNRIKDKYRKFSMPDEGRVDGEERSLLVSL